VVCWSSSMPGPIVEVYVERAQILALRARRLGAHDCVDQRAEVLQNLLLVEADLADRHVITPVFVEAELDAPT